MEQFENNDQLYKNLIYILKLFKNRPYHLAKYLIENEAFNERFLKKLLESDKLSEMSGDEPKSIHKAIYFIDISHMNDFFNSLTDEFENKSKSVNKMTKELNEKLDQCLKEEKYEDAIRIRDYMNKHNIKRNS